MDNSQILMLLNSIQEQLNQLRAALGDNTPVPSSSYPPERVVGDYSPAGGAKLANVEAFKATLSAAVAAAIPTYWMVAEEADKLSPTARFNVEMNTNKAFMLMQSIPNWIPASTYTKTLWGTPRIEKALEGHAAVSGPNFNERGEMLFKGVSKDDVLGIVKVMAPRIAEDLNQPVFPGSFNDR